jgi:hypothetical protein
MRRPTKPDTMPARIAAAVSAGVGSSIAVGLAWLPAMAAKPPVSVHPELLVAMTAGTAIVAGIVIALAALSVPAIAGGVRAAVAWVWLVGIGSGVAGYLTHKPYAPPRLGVVDAPSAIPVAWWSGPYLMIAIAVILGAGVAAVARWAEASRLGIALSGFAGPAVVASAYLIAGFGYGPRQLDPYRAALIAVGAGLVASVLVAIPGPTRGATEKPTTRKAEGTREAPEADDPSGYDPVPVPGAVRPEPNQPPLDETYDVYPREAAPVPADREQEREPAVAAPSVPSVSALAPESQRPLATMSQPPARTYEEDYSDWLRDLGQVPGQRDADREDQRL